MSKEVLKNLKEQIEEKGRIYNSHNISLTHIFNNLKKELDREENNQSVLVMEDTFTNRLLFGMMKKIISYATENLKKTNAMEQKKFAEVLNKVNKNEASAEKALTKQIKKMEIESAKLEELEEKTSGLFDSDSTATINSFPNMREMIETMYESMIEYTKTKSNECNKIVDTLNEKYLNEEEYELRK